MNWYAGMADMPLGVVPVVNDGAAVVQPAYVADVAKVLNIIASDPEMYAGKVVELGGPAERVSPRREFGPRRRRGSDVGYSP